MDRRARRQGRQEKENGKGCESIQAESWRGEEDRRPKGKNQNNHQQKESCQARGQSPGQIPRQVPRQVPRQIEGQSARAGRRIRQLKKEQRPKNTPALDKA